MGMELTITFETDSPTWEAIASALKPTGMSLVLRMIDGLPAFPDEIPEPSWKELRLSTTTGMLTIRRQPSCLAVVVWGNADAELLRHQKFIAWSCAKAGSGRIATPEGTVSGEEYLRREALFEA